MLFPATAFQFQFPDRPRIQRRTSSISEFLFYRRVVCPSVIPSVPAEKTPLATSTTSSFCSAIAAVASPSHSIAVDGVAGLKKPSKPSATFNRKAVSPPMAALYVDPNGATLKAIETMHLIGICNNTYSDSYRKYAKPGPTDVHVRQKLFQPYLKKLRDGMGYTHTAKTHSAIQSVVTPIQLIPLRKRQDIFGNAQDTQCIQRIHSGKE